MYLSRTEPWRSTPSKGRPSVLRKSKWIGRNGMSLNRRTIATSRLRSWPVPAKPGPSRWNVERNRLAPKSFLKKPICWPCSSVMS